MESAHKRFLFTGWDASKNCLVRFFDASQLVNKNCSCALYMEYSLFSPGPQSKQETFKILHAWEGTTTYEVFQLQ